MRMLHTPVTVGTADVQPTMAVREDRAWRPWGLAAQGRGNL